MSMTMQQAIEEVRAAPDALSSVRCAYDILTAKYRGERLKTYTHILAILQTDISVLWKKSGFLHCTSINRLLRIILLMSGRFEAKDIRTRWTLVWISPHQYVQVRIGNRWIDVDCWARNFGIPFGKYAHGFQPLRAH